MSTLVHTTRLGQVLQVLPRPLLALLDGWSHRRAQARARRRLAAWQRQKAAKAQHVASLADHPFIPKPWRD